MFAKKARLVLNFPNPREPTNEGVIGIGGTLTVDNLVQAYDHGIFPWPHDGYPLLWFCPDERGVIDFADVHPPKSFSKHQFSRCDPQLQRTSSPRAARHVDQF